MRGWRVIPQFAGLRLSHTPGRCVMCGTADDKRQVLSSGVILSEGVAPGLRGDLQFCGECIKAAAQLLGMQTSDAIERCEARAAEHAEAVREMKRSKAALDAALKKLS